MIFGIAESHYSHEGGTIDSFWVGNVGRDWPVDDRGRFLLSFPLKKGLFILFCTVSAVQVNEQN